jgi:hypothetical protein
MSEGPGARVMTGDDAHAEIERVAAIQHPPRCEMRRRVRQAFGLRSACEAPWPRPFSAARLSPTDTGAPATGMRRFFAANACLCYVAMGSAEWWGAAGKCRRAG